MPTIEDLVKLFDLEIEEEFRVYNNKTQRLSADVYKFSNHNLLWSEDGAWSSSVINILDFFTGRYSIIKNPWKPKNGNCYYYVAENNKISKVVWDDDNFDLAFYAVGNCFKTQKDAEEHIMEIKERLQKIYDSGKPLISVAKEQDK